MKKRCTNSACRREFRLDRAEGPQVCPHCGRVYRRGGDPGVRVELAGCQLAQRVRLVKALRRELDFPCLREAKERVDRLEEEPLVLGPMSREQARQELDRWQAAGAVARVASALEPAPQRYELVLTGWQKGCLPQARLMARRALQSPDFQTLRSGLCRVRSHPIVLARNLPEGKARAMDAECRGRGVHTQIRKQRAL